MKTVIKKTTCAFLIFIVTAGSADAFRVASYNVENLFDMKRDQTEYSDYVPGNRYGWTQEMLEIKTANLARVIRDMNPDILALQEVESRQALIALLEQLEKSGSSYPWYAVADSKKTTVKCAVISKFQITGQDEIQVAGSRRNILKVTFDVSGHPLTLYVNHWKSRRGPESERVASARALKRELDRIKPGRDYILAGDFNSSHNEYRTIATSPKLNNTGGLTGINHLLSTITKGEPVTEKTLTKSAGHGFHYNLWYELSEKRRWSHNFFGKKRSLDSIILPAALYDQKGISYVDNSFRKFTPDYLFSGRKVFRWQRARRGKGAHLGKGFSDHLPIYADFASGGPAGGSL